MSNFAWFATFPNFSHWGGSECPISPDSQLFHIFPTKVAQNDLEWPAHLWWAMYQFDHPIIYKDNFYSIQARDKPRRILFILFFTSWQCSSFVMGNVPIGLTQNDREWPIWSDSQLFQLFPTEAAQNDSEWPILPNLQLFKYFPSEATQNDWEWPISSDS